MVIALLDVELDNWGIKDGQPASDLDFSFPIETCDCTEQIDTTV